MRVSRSVLPRHKSVARHSNKVGRETRSTSGSHDSHLFSLTFPRPKHYWIINCFEGQLVGLRVECIKGQSPDAPSEMNVAKVKQLSPILPFWDSGFAYLSPIEIQTSNMHMCYATTHCEPPTIASAIATTLRMADPVDRDREVEMEDDYDEEADSDFDADGADAEAVSSTSDEEQDANSASQRPRKRRKIDQPRDEAISELDSGDEATIRAQKKPHRKPKTQADDAQPESDDESDGWRARTRTMRIREKEERKRNKLASSKGSTIDVNKIWEEMNRPVPVPLHMEADGDHEPSYVRDKDDYRGRSPSAGDGEKENVPTAEREETIVIKRTYKFAGEVHVEEKTVLKSSAEAQLWLSQQKSSKGETPAANGSATNRPLRKISRFDPNFSNLDTFKASWASQNAQATNFKGPKLNVVEKSKMDWAVHVDAEGLKEELDTHAKAKEGYLGRMDFLREVEDRKEAEARTARLKGR